ncbi:MAG: hypothetical protein FWH54_06075 [Methanobrevibacter sp.]|nr:hypothetical protein [Methanobrevibacter sp.]
MKEYDYRIVEELTRRFLNVPCPGCDKHLLITNLRNKKEFIKNLDFLAFK